MFSGLVLEDEGNRNVGLFWQRDAYFVLRIAYMSLKTHNTQYEVRNTQMLSFEVYLM